MIVAGFIVFGPFAYEVTPEFVAAVLSTGVIFWLTLQASKITCDQFVHSKVGEPRIVAPWLSGFYNDAGTSGQ